MDVRFFGIRDGDGVGGEGVVSMVREEDGDFVEGVVWEEYTALVS